MTPFTVEVVAPDRRERIEGVVSFTAVDASGSFGIQGRHAPLLTFLRYGLARLRRQDGGVEYLALAGGLLWFRHPLLFLHTGGCLRGTDDEKLAARAEHELEAEEEVVREIRASLRRLDERLLRRLARREE